MTWVKEEPKNTAGALMVMFMQDVQNRVERLRSLGEFVAATNAEHALDEVYDAYQWMMASPALPTDGEPKREFAALIASRVP